jgi:hypothetical protein
MGSVINFFLLPCAESRQRKMTLPSSTETSLWLDGNAMGVGAEITQSVFWAAEGTLGVDDPVLSEQDSQPRCKGARFGQMQHTTVELKCAGLKGGLEPSDELAAERAAEHPDREEKRWEELIHWVWSGASPAAAKIQ